MNFQDVFWPSAHFIGGGDRLCYQVGSHVLFFTLSQNHDQHQVRPPNLDDLPLPLLHRERDVLGNLRHRQPHHPHQS